MKDLLTSSESLQAMKIFLTHYCERSDGDDEIANVLSDASSGVWADGDPNDPAQWGDWLDAVAEVEKVQPAPVGAPDLDFKTAFRTMLTFLDRIYDAVGPNAMIGPILRELEVLPPDEPHAWHRWPDWLDATDTVRRGEGLR